MKNWISLVLITLLLAGCQCEEKEVLQDFVNDANRDYFMDRPSNIIFEDGNGSAFEMNTQPAMTYIRKLYVGEGCDYWSVQNVEQNFNIGDSFASIFLEGRVFAVRILSPNGNAIIYELQLSDSERSLDNHLENIEIAGFNFENVLVLTSRIHNTEIEGIESIIYSKERGIEMFYFRNGNYLKRQD